MRVLTSMTVAAALLAGVAALPAYAAPLTDQSRDGVGNQSIDQVAGRCGPHRHYVPGHRNHEGHFIRGHCIRYH